jgi:hypothetical protein
VFSNPKIPLPTVSMGPTHFGIKHPYLPTQVKETLLSVAIRLYPTRVLIRLFSQIFWAKDEEIRQILAPLSFLNSN